MSAWLSESWLLDAVIYCALGALFKASFRFKYSRWSKLKEWGLFVKISHDVMRIPSGLFRRCGGGLSRMSSILCLLLQSSHLFMRSGFARRDRFSTHVCFSVCFQQFCKVTSVSGF